ncbi:MAG: hypothetical protein HOC23_22970, partial [Halieaceae bacterium]|nr:hypothetical protein [Halieaceae bacterium]
MSSHNEPVNPIGFEAATPDGRPQQPARTGRSTPLWVLPALGALTILAAFIIFWLPGRVAPTTAPPASIATDVAPPTAVSRENSTPEETSPWSDAQLAKLRKEAQDVLAQLLDVQVALEEVGIEKWGQERLASAAAIASAADEQYRERLFVEARHSYEQALIAFQALLDAAPEALREQLDSARQAIEKGERDTAYSALDIAAAIEPGNEELAILRQRADLLGQLMPLLEQALEAESTGDLAKANTLLQQAAAIDPLHMRLKETQQRVETAFAAQRFSEAMSKGYSALAAGNFRRARSEFNTAAGQRPGSKEAASALQEVKDAETGHRLTTLQGRGQTLESLESWQQAVEAYQQALEIDSNVLFARTGLERSKTRARLDEQILSTLSQPLRLADQAVADDGQK